MGKPVLDRVPVVYHSKQYTSSAVEARVTGALLHPYQERCVPAAARAVPHPAWAMPTGHGWELDAYEWHPETGNADFHYRNRLTDEVRLVTRWQPHHWTPPEQPRNGGRK